MAKFNFKEFMRGGGAAIAGVLLVVAVGIFFFGRAGGKSTQSELLDDLSHRVFVDETGAAFSVKAEPGVSTVNPATGKQGYIAEYCWWTKDGKVNEDKPTYVLLNEYVNRPGPTFCPDCGRLVVAHNPSPRVPGSNMSPPPTKEEYERRRQDQGGAGAGGGGSSRP